MALVAYLLIGLPYALILAILAGILEAVPIVGPILGAIPALLVALSTDPTRALWVIAASLIIQGLENYLLVPRVMKQSVGVNPLAILLSLAAFTSLLGLAGALLAIPIAAIVQLFVNRFVISSGEVEVETPAGRGQLSLLRYETRDLASDIRKQLREKEDIAGFTEDIVENLEAAANHLDHILTLAEQRRLEIEANCLDRDHCTSYDHRADHPLAVSPGAAAFLAVPGSRGCLSPIGRFLYPSSTPAAYRSCSLTWSSWVRRLAFSG